MKRVVCNSVAGFITGAVLLMNSGCDWSTGGGSNSFNTSQGAGINMNFSGVYQGELAGGKAVANTSGGNILMLTISQVGNSITVVDNQGSRYTGSVGSPGLVANPVNGVFPTGAELVQSQINFAGKDGVSAKDIEFVGIIHVVSVTDIQGESSTETVTDEDVQTSTTTVVDPVTGQTTETTTITVGVPTDPFYQQTVTVVVTDTATGNVISSTTTTTGTTTRTTEFSITEANSQYRLEGTWIEQGGLVSQVKARSPGAFGLITTTDTETDTTTSDT